MGMKLSQVHTQPPSMSESLIPIASLHSYVWPVVYVKGMGRDWSEDWCVALVPAWNIETPLNCLI